MEKFYLGMDIGTNSVGMACTDEKYRLLRAKGQDCWSVRLFEESKTALERRIFRASRRRLQRRKYRITLLQELFAPFIADKEFFIRLNNSQYLPEDKNVALLCDKNTLFNDSAYDDKTFHSEFKTIYHLREALMTKGSSDLRLYYIAIHHIIKYRGHFLFEGNIGDIRSIKSLFIKLNDACTNIYGEEDAPNFDETYADSAKDVLLKADMGFKERQAELEKLFCATTKIEKEIIKGICGYSVSPKTLFGEGFAEEKAFAFKDISDEQFFALQSIYGDYFALLEAIRAIFGFATFEKLLVGHPNISSSMIAVYNKHKSDLKQLKNFISSEKSEEYNKIFRSTAEGSNYVNYIGSTKNKSKKVKVKCCSDEAFRQYLKKIISAIEAQDGETKDKILEELEQGSFLPKILHSDNGLFPHQVNEDELIKIIDSMVKIHPQTEEMAKKLLPLFRFRIPYYVGPLTGKNGWAVRKSDEKITPWNFNDVVDLPKSNEEFMRRMTNKCSYLHCEDVLPKCSVIYQKYNVLNQINKLKINDRPLSSVNIKQKIFNELFLKYSRVSDKKIIELLVREGEISEEEAKITKITGKDGEINASMSSYIALKKILGDFACEPRNADIMEKIILWHTLNTDKGVVEGLIKTHCKDIPEIINNIKAIKGLTFKDFGRLSERFLDGIKAVDKETGEAVTILDLLYNTNQNLNEILFNEKYDFNEIIKDENGEESEEISYKDVEELYVSPAVRRGIWQSLIMADEYINAIGKVPDKIFVEVTREDGQKGDLGRKLSRKKQLSAKYKLLEKDKFSDIIAELDSEDVSDMDLRKERLYLYFRQLGRCAYSGKSIDLSALGTDVYDVDHILPRSYIKDDALDNKVLVCKEYNKRKNDIYPVPADLRQVGLWKLWYDKDLISKKTFDRLMRIEPLGENDYDDFIARQKVITDQTAKAVAELLKRKYPESTIVYSKAKNVIDFRQKFGLYKCRETNNLHHARDAYLNIVVGNVFHTCFSTPMAMFYKKDGGWREKNLDNLFVKNTKNAWDESSIKTVKMTYQKHTMVVTQYAFCNKGAFYDQTIYNKEVKSVTAPRKGKGVLSDASKYGGYKSQNTAYFAVVLSKDKKGNQIKTIEAVPVIVSYKLKSDPNALLDYFNLYLKEPEILMQKLKVRQLVEYNGALLYIAGISNDTVVVHSARELFTDNCIDEYVRQVQKLAEMKKNGVIKNEEEYVVKTNRNKEKKLIVNSDANMQLLQNLIERLNKPCYQGLSPFISFKTNLECGVQSFKALNVLEQCEVLLQIIKFFKCNAELSDLSLIGRGGYCGKIKFNKNITNVDFRIINMSPAGLIRRVKKI